MTTSTLENVVVQRQAESEEPVLRGPSGQTLEADELVAVSIAPPFDAAGDGPRRGSLYCIRATRDGTPVELQHMRFVGFSLGGAAGFASNRSG